MERLVNIIQIRSGPRNTIRKGTDLVSNPNDKISGRVH